MAKLNWACADLQNTVRVIAPVFLQRRWWIDARAVAACAKRGLP
jgi:hypothetical protein